MPALRTGRSAVRRRLFVEDHDDPIEEDDPIWVDDNRTNAFLESMRVDRERARQMWNFDFETETPLVGVWQWERVENSPDHVTIEIYDRANHAHRHEEMGGEGGMDVDNQWNVTAEACRRCEDDDAASGVDSCPETVAEELDDRRCPETVSKKLENRSCPEKFAKELDNRRCVESFTEELDNRRCPETFAKELDNRSHPETFAKELDNRSRPDTFAKKLDNRSHPETFANELDNRSHPETFAKELDNRSHPETFSREQDNKRCPETLVKEVDIRRCPETVAEELHNRNKDADHDNRNCEGTSVNDVSHSNETGVKRSSDDATITGKDKIVKKQSSNDPCPGVEDNRVDEQLSVEDIPKDKHLACLDKNSSKSYPE